MNMKNLQYVLAVCQEGNITAAAHTQHVSQPALSQAIKQEEQNLGTSIFQRGSTPLQLTPAGKRYVETGRQIMMLEQNLKNELSDLNGESTGILRFGISAQEGMYLLPRVLPRFFQMYPQVKLCVEERGSALLEEMLLDGTVDIVLARYERKRQPLEYRLFAKNKLVLLCAQDTALARKYPSGSSISLRDAQGEAFVLLEKEHHIGQFVREQFVQYGMKVKVLAEVNSFDTAKRIALSSGAVTLSPYPLFSTDPDLERQGNVYFLKNMKSSHHSYLCWRKNMYQTRYMRDWIALLEEGAQQ